VTAGDAMGTLICLLISAACASLSFQSARKEKGNGWGIVLVYIMFGMLNLTVFATIMLDLFGVI